VALLARVRQLFLLLAENLRVAFLVDGLTNLENLIRPRLFAVVELVKKAEVGLEPDAVRLDDGHVVAVMVTLRRVFLAPVHVRLEVHVQVAQALKLAVGPPIDAEVAAPEEGAKRGRGSVRRACLLVSKNEKKCPKVCSSLENLRTFSETTGRTHLALKRVVPMLKTLAAAASVSIATCDSVFFVIPCRKSA